MRLMAAMYDLAEATMMSVDVPMPVYLRANTSKSRGEVGELVWVGHLIAGEHGCGAHVMPELEEVTTPSSFPDAPSRTVVPW